jgi:hypothetical protein
MDAEIRDDRSAGEVFRSVFESMAWLMVQQHKAKDLDDAKTAIAEALWAKNEALQKDLAVALASAEPMPLVDEEIHLAVIEATKRTLCPQPNWSWSKAFAKDIQRRMTKARENKESVT